MIIIIFCFQHKEDKLSAAYYPLRRRLNSGILTDIAHLVAARDGKSPSSQQLVTSGDSIALCFYSAFVSQCSIHSLSFDPL